MKRFIPPEQFYPEPPGATVETLLTGLDVVWSLEFASDGRLLLTEKAGRSVSLARMVRSTRSHGSR